jgi:branched-chain amino acid transport system substrate-binding protein
VEPVVLSVPAPAADGRLPLAAIFPTVGRYALSGIQSMNGARLAVEELNRRGGVHGRRLNLLEYPTGSYFLDARQGASLAAAAGVLAIVGSTSSELSMAIAGEAEAHGLVQVSNVSTAQDLTWDPASGRDRRFVFRVCTPDVMMGAQLAAFARDRLGARRAAVLYEVGRTYSAKLARSFLESFRDPGGGRVTAEFFYLTLETEFRSQLRAVQDFRPDVVFIPGSFTDASLIALEAESLGLRATLLGADGWSNPLLFKRGGPRRAAYFADLCAPPAAFNGRYRQEFGREAEGCRAALAHDAVEALATALETLGPLTDAQLAGGLAETRRRLRDALAEADFRGETGRIRFDEHGDSRRGVAILAVEPAPDGRHVARLFARLGES